MLVEIISKSLEKCSNVRQNLLSFRELYGAFKQLRV